MELKKFIEDDLAALEKRNREFIKAVIKYLLIIGIPWIIFLVLVPILTPKTPDIKRQALFIVIFLMAFLILLFISIFFGLKLGKNSKTTQLTDKEKILMYIARAGNVLQNIKPLRFNKSIKKLKSHFKKLSLQLLGPFSSRGYSFLGSLGSFYDNLELVLDNYFVPGLQSITKVKETSEISSFLEKIFSFFNTESFAKGNSYLKKIIISNKIKTKEEPEIKDILKNKVVQYLIAFFVILFILGAIWFFFWFFDVNFPVWTVIAAIMALVVGIPTVVKFYIEPFVLAKK